MLPLHREAFIDGMKAAAEIARSARPMFGQMRDHPAFAELSEGQRLVAETTAERMAHIIAEAIDDAANKLPRSN
jgi:hypothetical protein